MPATPEDSYRGQAGHDYQQQKRAIPTSAIPWVAKLRAQKLQPHISNDAVVLELGAGLGWNLAQLRCARRIASDLSDYISPALKQSGLEFVANTSTLPDALAHVVICHHVLEHVENPPAMLREARRLLRPNGHVLIFVPYEKESRYRQYDPAEPNHHLYSWNVQTLANLVATQGFAIHQAHLGEFGYDRFAAKQAVRFQLGEFAFRAIRRFVHLLRPGREVRLIATKI